MKRILVLLLLVIAIIIIFILLRYPQNGKELNSGTPSSNILYNSTAIASSSQESSGIIAMASKTDVYMLKEYEGRIGVYHNDDDIPYQQIDVDVSSLPDADQKLLKDGIKVYSIQDLNNRIEDYAS